MSDPSDELRAILAAAERAMNGAQTNPQRQALDTAHAEWQRDQQREILRDRRIPVRYTRPIGGTVRETAPLSDVLAWHAGRGWGIVLGGACGTGKTFAAVTLLLRADGGLFATAEEVASPDGAEIVRRARSTRLLVLDEMGAEALYDAGAARLHALISDRYAHERRTIITTNLNLDDWGRRYGERLVDRFRAADGGAWIEYTGESLRGAR